jgi:phosphinothricin acetyltransferase
MLAMFQIRAATEGDLPGIFAIFADVVRNSTAIWIDDPGTIEDRRAWLLLRRSQNYPVLVAVENGKVLGYGSFGDFRPYEGFRGSIEHSIYVAPEAHRRGVGRALLTALIAAAQELGKKVIVAAIDADNNASIELHRAFGFVETGRMPGVGEKFGRPLDMVLMQREL